MVTLACDICSNMLDVFVDICDVMGHCHEVSMATEKQQTAIHMKV